jgi:hypothetical protein
MNDTGNVIQIILNSNCSASNEQGMQRSAVCLSIKQMSLRGGSATACADEYRQSNLPLCDLCLMPMDDIANT